jgi:hypothetical protein
MTEMKDRLTNAGKKDLRQYNQILDKQVKEGRQAARNVEGRTSARVHRVKGQKSK